MRQTGRCPGIIIYDDMQFKHNEYVFLPHVSFCFIFRHAFVIYFSNASCLVLPI